MVEIPDEYGLSSDSLRGSTQHIRPDLIAAVGRVSPDTGNPLMRAPLSRNEIIALRGVGLLVDENGYEVKPEPVAVVAPMAAPLARVRTDVSSVDGPYLTNEPSPYGQGSVRPSVDYRQGLTDASRNVPRSAVEPPINRAPAADYETVADDNPVRPFGGIPVKDDNPHRDFSELPGVPQSEPTTSTTVRRSRSDMPNPPAVESEGMHFEDDEPNGAKDSD